MSKAALSLGVSNFGQTFWLLFPGFYEGTKIISDVEIPLLPRAQTISSHFLEYPKVKVELKNNISRLCS